jgi:hypothetical protein
MLPNVAQMLSRMESLHILLNTPALHPHWSITPHGLSPLTRSTLESVADRIQTRIQDLQQQSLVGRLTRFIYFLRWRQGWLFVQDKGSYKQDFTRLAALPTATMTETLNALQELYVTWIPLAVACAKLSAIPRQMLQARGIADPDAHVFSDEQQFRSDMLSLWGIVHEFPSLAATLERCSLPHADDEGGIFFRSAWLWFKRRQMWRVMEWHDGHDRHDGSHGDIDVAAPRMYEFFDEYGTASAALSRQFIQPTQPFAKFREWTWNDEPFARRRLWRWLEQSVAAQDAVHRAGREVLCGLRFQLQRHASALQQRGALSSVEALWGLTLHEAQSLGLGLTRQVDEASKNV